MIINGKKVNISFTNRGNQKGEILIYDTIGEDWFGEGVTAKNFATELKGLGDVNEINVRLASDGGSVFDGTTIYNLLVSHPAKIIVDIDGQALSIASVIAMAGDEIRMSKNGYLMIHEPHTIAGGDASELRKVADTLDLVRNQIIDTYHDNRNIDRDQLSAWVKDETWFSAEEALAAGFVDEITNAVEIAAHYDYSKFQNPPKNLLSPSNVVKSNSSDGQRRASAAIDRMNTGLKHRKLY